jgi:hypothetical protein
MPSSIIDTFSLYFKTIIFRFSAGSQQAFSATIYQNSEIQLRLFYTAKTKCRKFETNIPRKGISGPQSQFPHSCVCERIIYSHDGSVFSAGGNMWTDPGNI